MKKAVLSRSLKTEYTVQQIRCRCCSGKGQPQKRPRHDPALPGSENGYGFSRWVGIHRSAMTDSGYNDTSVLPFDLSVEARI
ncbi:MAG: hypothetical protein PHV32_05985 [Eubacteriales bacterium]|nr:hypothetical protein [Eubacteriales bacterium]